MPQIRKVLAFAFWELRRVLNAVSDDSWIEIRAMSLLVLHSIGADSKFLRTRVNSTEAQLHPDSRIGRDYFYRFSGRRGHGVELLRRAI
jgi:hypothetical protein